MIAVMSKEAMCIENSLRQTPAALATALGMHELFGSLTILGAGLGGCSDDGDANPIGGLVGAILRNMIGGQ